MGDFENGCNFEDGCNFAKQITKSLRQTFYKLDDEKILYTKPDIHRIEKTREGNKEKEEAASPAVNAERNLDVSENNNRMRENRRLILAEFKQKVNDRVFVQEAKDKKQK